MLYTDFGKLVEYSKIIPFSYYFVCHSFLWCLSFNCGRGVSAQKRFKT